ncbi:ABC transporter substrate-binding protein [Metarhizobium album]|nr:ABC transporter substrate-binding protein [Rhizobium album]
MNNDENRMGITRKQFLRGVTAIAAGSFAAPAILSVTSPAQAAGEGPVKLGFLFDQSGGFGEYGLPAVHAAELAIEEINASGGINGREVEAVIVDTQSDTSRYVSMARMLIGRDKVDAIFGAIGSQDREAIRPIAHAAKIPYFYPTCYEGGVADNWTFCTGVVPEQGFATLIPYMVEQYGANVYDLAADYVWGQLSTLWLNKYVGTAKGKLVGSEAVPLNVSDFNSTLGRVQAAKPNWIYSSLTGKEQSAFFTQRASLGVNIPLSDFVITLAQAGGHRRMKSPVLAGLHETFSYLEELPGERNADFVKRFRAKFPDEVFISQPAQNTYVAVQLYAKAAALAGNVTPIEIVKALETGISYDAPEGTVRVDPKSHHVSHNVHLGKVAQDHTLEIVKSWENIEPFWLGSIGVDLTKKSESRQYSPLDA